MAKAYMCDRCKAFYTVRQIVGMDLIEIKQNGAKVSYDLCPKCKQELKVWVSKVRKDEKLGAEQEKPGE